MFRSAPVTRTLEAALRDVSSARADVRAEAVRDLALQEDAARARVLSALDGALRDDQEAAVRAAAAVALADLKGVEALPGLLLAVEDADAHVRQMAVTALGEIGDARATGRLRRALDDARPEIRFQAVIAFPRVCAQREEAVEALVRATRDDDPLVCQIALRMAEELATSGDDDEAPAEEGPAPIDPALMERARALLEHRSPLVRSAAAVLLARGGDAGGHPVVVAVATGALRGADREDEAAAIELCGELGLEAASGALERRAWSGLLGVGRDPLYWYARVALARMGHARATREILQDIRGRDRHRCTLAVAAAGRARLVAARDPIAALRGDDRRADQGAVEDALAALEPDGARRRRSPASAADG